MKFAIVGAGGVGAYLGARLIQAGRSVAFLARGANLKALTERGIRLASPLGSVATGPVTAADDARSLGPADAVFLTTKLYDLAEVAKRAAPLFGPKSCAVPVQNGVEAHEIVARALPGAHVLKATIYVSSFLTGPGEVLQKSPFCRVRFAAAEPASRPAAEALAAALKDVPGIEASISADIDADLWRKMVMLASFSAVACIKRKPVGDVLENPSDFALFKSALAESVAVARASKVALPDDIEAATIGVMRQFPREAKPSMLEDMEAGRPLELDFLSGAIARLGRAHNIPTPTHDAALDQLSKYAPKSRAATSASA
ncbi:MAG TPA: 2-dehydropantoate 2-reductase [Alphaproteobacteria bacterium]|jgi:2-dehydropantoate 2-reductase